MTTENTETNSQGAGKDVIADPNAGAPTPPAAEPSRAPEPKPAPKGDDEQHGTPLPKKEDGKPEPKPEPKPEGEEGEDDDVQEKDWTQEYVEFEDAAGQSVVNLLKEAGVKPVEANAFFAEATKTGDLSKVRWDLIEARLGKDKATLARIGIEQHYEKVWKVQSETQQFAYAEVGGEANWKKVAKWVAKTEKADPSRKAEFDNLRKAIDIGGPTAQYAVKAFKAAYEAGGNSGFGNVQQIARGDKQTQVVGGPLTRADSLIELKKAHNRNATQQEIEHIRQRRAAGRAQGI